MHKRLLITVLSILICTSAMAQQQNDHWVWPDEHIENALFLHVGIEPKIGAGIAMASNPSFYDFDFKGGFTYQLGAAFNIHVAHHPSLSLRGIDRVGMEIEALYAKRNFKSGNATMAMKCLEIPILVQFYLTRSLQLEAGLTPIKILNVAPDYLQNGHVVANTSGITGRDVMISAGVCYTTSFGLIVDLRYNHGLSKWAENLHSKTRTAMVSVSYQFALTD